MNHQEAIETAKDLPWAKWVAQDRTGSWWAFELEPEATRDGTYYGGSGNCCELGSEEMQPEPKAEVVR